MQANLLKAKMVEAGHTQRSLAREINMSENSLSSKLSGRRAFDLDEVSSICNVLHIEDSKDKANIFLT